MSLTYFNLFIFFCLGTIVGSFITVLVHRLKFKLAGLFFGRSCCPNCQKKLSPIELVPIFSYLFSRAKCRKCKVKINPSYPITELLTGTVFTITFAQFHTTQFLLTCWLIIFSIAIAISLYDYQTHEIPITLSIPLGVVALLTSFFLLETSPQQIISGGLIGFFFFYLQYFISKGNWTGLGDADLGLIIGILMGPLNTIQTLIISYTIGAIVGISLIIFKKTGLKTQIAFGPFLMIGLFINATFNQQITNLIFPYL